MDQISAFVFVWAKRLGMPLVGVYHMICGSVFFNTEIEGDTGLEYWANQALAPVHYLLAGRKAIYDEKTHHYQIEQRFNYDEHFGLRTLASMAALPLSVTVGSGLKALAYLDTSVQKRHHAVITSLNARPIKSNLDYYACLGVEVGNLHAPDKLRSPIYDRSDNQTEHLAPYKDALGAISTILRKHEIPHWLDCGTLLGAYRYRGFIPWDKDLDIAILQPDFDNVKNALGELDSNKYQVLDWSSRDKAKTYLMVHIKGTSHLIDIYHFAVDADKKELRGIVSNIDSMFLPRSWKICEGRFARSVPYDMVFPLKKTHFEGIEVYVPNDTPGYLKGVYGDDLRPAKIYDKTTGRYEKDLSHPYWQLEHVH
ncbi:MAG: LicD family protein [Chlamydiia bacterium]|nr:LicD family protein [Chlamydiia bacterium]